MRYASGLLLVLSLIWLVAEPARAQQQETLWQRFKGVFTGKNKNDAAKTEVRPSGNDAKRAAPAAPSETRGVVYVEEPPVAPMPKAAAQPKAPPTRTLSTGAAPAVKQPSTAAMPTIRNAQAAKHETLVQGLTRQVSQKCPQARNVKVTFTGEKEVTVEMEVRTQEEANALVEHVFAIRDLDAYRVNVKFTVPQP